MVTGHFRMLAARSAMALRLAAIVGTLALAACSNGGGSSNGGGDNPPPFASTAQAWWTTETGARWTFQHIDLRAGGVPTLVTVADRGETAVGGRRARQFVRSQSLLGGAEEEVEYRYYDSGAIHTLADAELTGWTGAQDYAELPAPLVAGTALRVFDATQMIDLDIDGLPDSLRVEVTVTLAHLDNYSVAAGEFRNVVSARQEIKATVSLSGSHETASATGVLTTWYAAGVGVVRRVFEDPSAVAPNNTVSDELVGVQMSATRAGLSAGQAALDGIGWGHDSRLPPAAGLAVANDRYMAVAVAESGNVEGSIVAAGGATLWRGTVLATSAPYALQSAAVVFDGTDFRVVASRSNTSGSPAEWALVAQRVGSTGLLRDGPTGALLDSGIGDTGTTLSRLQAAAGPASMLLSWARYDPTLVSAGPGLAMPRGYIIEGRAYGAQNQPLGPRFDLGPGVPSSVAARADQFVVVKTSALFSFDLVAWALDSSGVPVNTAGQVISNSTGAKSGAQLHVAGADLWLSWLEPRMEVSGSLALRVARIGRDAVLLDGTPDAPGRWLLPAGDGRNAALPTIAAGRSALVWPLGANLMQASVFDTALLAGSAALPADVTRLQTDPFFAMGMTALPMGGAAFDGGLLLAWQENEQYYLSDSDRVMVAVLRPKLAP